MGGVVLLPPAPLLESAPLLPPPVLPAPLLAEDESSAREPPSLPPEDEVTPWGPEPPAVLEPAPPPLPLPLPLLPPAPVDEACGVLPLLPAVEECTAGGC